MKQKVLPALILILIFIIMSLGLWSVWSRQTRVFSESKLKVTTSFYPLYFLAQEIGGDKMEVTNLTPAGVEPHDYEPTARDIIKVQQSKLLILNGGRLEAWGEKLKKDLKDLETPVLEVGEGLLVGNDPHLWLSPELFKQEASLVVERLSELDPANSAYYAEKGEVLKQKLGKLQEDYLQGLASCKTRDFVTSHEAFGYLAREFGLNQVAIAGLTPEEEPSTKQMIEVVKIAKERNIQYIFFEKLVSQKLSETIAQEVGAQTLVLDPIEGISDNDASEGKNYLTIMEENLTNLKIALECQ